MKKNGNKSSDDSKNISEESNKKSEKVMIPFFETNESILDVNLVPSKPPKQRKPKFSKGQHDSNLPKNRNFNHKRDASKSLPTKEIGINSEPPIMKQVGINGEPVSKPTPLTSDPGKFKPADHRNSWPLLKSKDNKAHFNASHNAAPQQSKIAYINKNNVGNIRPLTSMYDTHEDFGEKPADVISKLKRDFKPSFNCDIDSVGRPVNFVDALIRNSNSFEDVVVDESNRYNRTNKSQELKSVLTKMGILDKSQPPKGDVSLGDIDKNLGNHYVFPKYMTSPDPSSIPIPGSL